MLGGGPSPPPERCGHTFGTSLPILSKTRVEPSFYDATNLPIAVIITILIGYSLFMQWEVQDGPYTFRRS